MESVAYPAKQGALDGDIVMGNDFRVIQFTPPGSECSISFGKGVTAAGGK